MDENVEELLEEEELDEREDREDEPKGSSKPSQKGARETYRDEHGRVWVCQDHELRRDKRDRS